LGRALEREVDGGQWGKGIVAYTGTDKSAAAQKALAAA
jgi:hypothetical protein